MTTKIAAKSIARPLALHAAAGLSYLVFLIALAYLTPPAANAASVELGTKAVIITRAEQYRRLCAGGDPGACALLDAAARSRTGTDDILNRPRTYGHTADEVIEYLKHHNLIIKTEIYE